MQYEIIGDNLPAVICQLESGEGMITERGSMCWMSPNMEMKTTSNGGLGKAVGRMFAGEAMFQNVYTAVGGSGMITFASSFPGSIRCYDVTPQEPLIVQKAGFLASEVGVNLSVHFKKRFGAGFFGGEGFIMQKISGNGKVFIEIDGHAVEYNIREGQSIIVDTGNLAVMSASCTMDIVPVRGAKNVLFGGEGLFNTIVTGPGRVVLQTMPVSSLASTIAPHVASN